MNENTITLSRERLEAAIKAALVQESHNSWISGSENCGSPISSEEAARTADRIVQRLLSE